MGRKLYANGSNIHLTDSANGKNVAFGLYGKAEQKQYSGKNLLQITATSQTVNGVTFTVDNGCITVNGTATEAFFIEIGRTNALEAGNYTISGCPNGGSETTFNFEAVSVKAGSNNWVTRYIEYGNEAQGSINGTDSQAFIANIRIRSGVTVNNLVFKPMIRLASITDSTYEPFTNGASPNPDYPQEITVSGSDGSVEVVSCGKNLLKPRESLTESGISYTTENDGSVNVSGQTEAVDSYGYIFFSSRTSLPTYLKIGEKYIASADSSNNNVKMQMFYAPRNESGWVNVFTVESTPKEFEIPKEATGLLIRLYVPRNVTVSDAKIYPMIRLASDTDSTYEPYTETTSTIPTPDGLCGIKVSSGGNYTDENGQQWICDEVVKYADGSGQGIQRIAEYICDGTKNFSIYADSVGKQYPCFASKILSGRTVKHTESELCSHNVIGKLNPIISGSALGFTGNNNPVYSDYVYISVEHETIGTTVESTSTELTIAFNTWVKAQYENGTPLTFKYVLETPIITDLSAEEIAEIEKLHTFYPITNISNDSDCGMAVTYVSTLLEFIKPKTDWTSKDSFDYVAYNRVSGNILFLKELADDLFGNLTELSLETEKENLSLIYARHMNAIEDGLDRLNIETYKKNIGDKKTYYPNKNVPNADEYNRIENACLMLYEALQAHKRNLPRLAFRLGNQKGIRV